MRSLHLYGTCALVLALAALAAAEDGAAGPREIFRVTFDEGTPNAVLARGAAAPYQARVDEYVSGAVGKAAVMKKKYAAIRFDGRGNIDLSRGTWGFFYQFVEEPNVREWESLVSVASDVEGYWSGVTQVIQRSERVQLHFFDAGRYTPRMDFKPIYKRWKAGEWHHLAFVWDRDQGLKLYEDGVPVDDHWGKHRWDFTNSPRMLALGEWIYSSLQFGIDEVRIFSDALTDAQVAQLAKGQDPTGAPRPRAPAEETLQRELKRMGWTADEAAALPALEAGSGARFVQARIVSANDACRQINQPYDGLWDSTWPLQRYGASTKGRRLDLATEEGSSFDRVRLFMHRPFRGRLMELDPAKGPVELCRLDAEDGVFLRAKLPKPCANTRVFLEREGGWLGQIELSRAEPLGAARAAHETLCLHPLEKMPDTLMGHALLAETHPDGDAPARAAADSCPRWTKRTPACGGLQILAGSYPEPVALNGVRLKLVVEGLTEPTAVQVKVKEPVMSDRNWLTAEAVLQPKGEGAQTYVLQLEGRPVVPFPGGEKGPALELGLALSASKPLTWVLGEGGTTVETLATDLEKALPVATADQIEWAREAYSQTNEGHIWDNVGLQGWGVLFHPLNWLARFAPEERATMELMGRVRWRKENLPWAEPKNEAGAPEWAFWQREAFKDCKSIIHWIIDHRQVETGEFGGVWGDDTDMVEYWTDYVLSAEDPKISNALRRFWDGVYRDALRDGVSRTIRDNLHSYEEGMGCIAHQLLLDYGDPIAVEHTMRATSHLDKWMAKNEDGTYRFLSNYQGYGGVWTEGNFGKDESRNALMLIPGGYLVWYNRHPYPAKYISGWTLNRAGPGIVADASWFLSNDEAGRKAWYAGKAAEYLKAARYAHQTNCLFHHTPVEEEHKPLLLNFAAKNDFLKGNLPDYAGYSPSMTEHWWMAYMASGDAKYLVESYKQACRFINNQRWLYTEAQPSTDRIPLPKTTVIRARVGAFVTERGGHTNTWPMHGISYTKNGNEVAALVTENAEKAFTVRLYPFAGQPLPLQFRLWRLWPGRYKLTLSKDANDDGQPEEALETREVEVDRGCFQEVVLPPGACAILRLEALAAQPPVFDLPDPAIAARELVLEYGDHLHVTVHNLGTQPVKNLKVRIIDGFSGKIVEEKTIAQIPAALDLTPQTALLEFQNLNAYTKSFIRVELDPEKEQPDLNRYNNTAELKY